MAGFTDNLGRRWSLDVNIESVEAVHRALGVSLYTCLEEDQRGLKEILANLPGLAHVCYILAGAETEGVDQRAFAKGLKGDCLDHMVDAFLEALTDFFPDSRRRAALQTVVRAAQMLRERTLARGAQALAELDLEAVLDKVLADHTPKSKKKSGGSQGSSASTRGR